MAQRERWLRIAAGFLSISYGIGAPLTAYAELTGHVLSQRFGYPSEFIYVICAVQLVCAIGILVRRLAPWAAGAFTVITLGAIASHFRIGSPTTAIPALVYTVIQIWYGWNRLGVSGR